MNLSRFSVYRPVFTSMVACIVVILGVVSLMRLPVDLMPDITYPTLSISTRYENASPDEVEELITRPIEEALSAVPGVQEITSTSGEGESSVRVSFSWGTDINDAASDVRDRLDRVIPRLPDDASRPSIRKYDLANFPILILGASTDLDPVQARQILEDQIKYRFERIPGVAAFDVSGGLKREIQVQVDIDKIKALGLSLDQILSVIRSGNINLPAGVIERDHLDVRIRTPGAYQNLDEIRDTIIALRQQAPVRLRDVADVVDTWQKQTSLVRINGRPGMRLAVNKQSGTNTVEVARRVLEELERVNRDYPQLQLIPIINTSEYIERSIANVSRSALFGGLLAVFVLLFFLRNLRSTAIIAVSIPLSIVATFVMIYFGGFTLNIMTLGGLALGVGMLVDNAIVVLENITRLGDNGLKPKEAAIEGGSEVTAAIIASTLTTIAVFLPLVFVRGMAGVMFRQLALVVAFALLCSLAASIFLVPMLSSKILRFSNGNGRRNARKSGLLGMASRVFEGLESEYQAILRFALRHRVLVIIGGALCLGGSFLLIPYVGVELMPAADESEVRVYGDMEVGTRVGIVDQKFEEIDRIVRETVPEMTRSVSYLGGSGFRITGSHRGQLQIALKRPSERTRSSEQIADDLRVALAHIPGIEIRTRAGQGLFLLRMATRDSDRLNIEIRGHDFETADVLAQQVEAVIREVDGIADTRLSRESGTPEETIIIDRRKAADMKLTVSRVAEMLRTVLAGSQAGYYLEAGRQFLILVKVRDADRMRLEEILDLTITNADSENVVLRNILSVQPRLGPVTIDRKDQERITTVRASYSGRDMGAIIADIREGLQSIVVPRDFSIDFGGEYEEQQRAFRELRLGFILALLMVYMVMAAQFESLRDPFVVMFSVPLAAIGVILILFLTGTTFNIQSYIGCIMLGGIVVNNAILLVDCTNLLRRRDNMSIDQAIVEAGRRRLRPILMTALTTMLGLVPLALGVGDGGEAQAPMARAVIGGLFSSTVITLVFVPVVYSIFQRRPGHSL